MSTQRSWKAEFETTYQVDLNQVNHLLLGSGTHTEKRISGPNGPYEWQNLITLDHNPDVNPTVEWDLNRIPLPFASEVFDEVHAYEVLEHCGFQGDFRFFFQQFADFWRILKPGGLFCASVPMWDSPWAWGDPSHTRVIPKEALIFLNQLEYQAQVDGERPTSMSDFRRWYQADFDCVAGKENEHQFQFVLKAVKPSRAHRSLEGLTAPISGSAE
jgi:SAM-dependent methyltransferase